MQALVGGSIASLMLEPAIHPALQMLCSCCKVVCIRGLMVFGSPSSTGFVQTSTTDPSLSITTRLHPPPLPFSQHPLRPSTLSHRIDVPMLFTLARPNLIVVPSSVVIASAHVRNSRCALISPANQRLCNTIYVSTRVDAVVTVWKVRYET